MHGSISPPPRVDVVIPCYNYGRYLERCVSSVLLQPVSVRVIIIDDASPDDTDKIGPALASDDERVEYRRHPSNLGHICTYNEGIEWLENDYFILLSADDMLIPGALGKVIAFLESNPEVGLAYGDAIKFRGTAPPINISHFPCSVTVKSGHTFIAEVCQKCENPVASPAAIVRASVQKRIGGYLPELPHSGDLEMWLRFAVHSNVGIVNAPVSYYRQHGTNMSAKYNAIPLAPLQQHRLMFELFFEKFGDRLPDADKLATLARKTLAARAFWSASRQFDSGSLDAVAEYLDFVSKADPSFVGSSAWQRFRYKRALGTKVWGVLQPLISSIRVDLSKNN